jgi:hypothetical protein
MEKAFIPCPFVATPATPLEKRVQERVCVKELQLLSFSISEGIFIAMLVRKHHGQKLLVERI